MDNTDFKIGKITIAINNIEQMVVFYNKVFNASLEKKAHGMYSGKIGEINILSVQMPLQA